MNNIKRLQKIIVFSIISSIVLLSTVFLANAVTTNLTANSSVVLNLTNITNSTNSTNTTANIISPYTQQIIRAYLNTGENFSVMNLTYDSAKYTLVLVNSNPSMVLDSNNFPVTNTTVLSALAQLYQSQVALPFNATLLNQTVSYENNLNQSLSNCVIDYWQFENGVQVCYEDTFYKFQCDLVYGLDLGEALNFSYNITFARESVDNGTAQMNASIKSISQAVGNLTNDYANSNIASMTTDLKNLNSDTANFTSGYNMFEVGHTDNIGYYPFATDGGLNRCAINTTALTGLQTIAGVANQLPNQTNIVNGIESFVQSRNASAQIKLIGVADLQEITNLNQTFEQTNTQYQSQAGFSLIGLNSQMASLQQESLQIGNQTELSSAQNLSNSINTTVNSISQALVFAQTQLPNIVKATVAANQANANVTAAAQRLGPSDVQSANLNSQYTQLNSQLQVMKSNIQDGNPLTSGAIQNITNSFQSLSATAQSDQPQQNQIDPILILEVIVLLGLVIGAVLLLKKFKPQKTR